jgi:hypothetical protein
MEGLGSSQSLVTLSRNDDTDVRERQIYARIDDGPRQMLYFGDTVTIDVTAGEHRLRSNNTLFWKRMTFSIKPGEHLEFVFINRATWIGLGIVAFFIGGVPLQLVIQRR